MNTVENVNQKVPFATLTAITLIAGQSQLAPAAPSPEAQGLEPRHTPVVAIACEAGAPPKNKESGAQESSARTLGEAGDKVAEGLMNGTLEVQGYRRQLAWEGLLRLGKATRRQSYLDWVVAESAKRGLTPGSEANRRRAPFNCLVYRLYEATGDKDWLPGFIEQTRRYRREVARSPEGAILHPRGKKRGGGQAMLIDALQDSASRMAMLGRATGDDSCYEEAVRQFRLYREVVRDPKSGLWSQGRGWLEDPEALSPGAWSRGHGWLIRGMVDTLLLLPPDSRDAEELRGYLRELADALLAVQQPGGMWHCLLHRPSSQSPPETSGTALIAGNLAIAVDAGILDEQPYSEAARRAFAALPAFVDEKGVVHSVSPGPGPLSEEEPWAVEAFPPGNEQRARPFCAVVRCAWFMPDRPPLVESLLCQSHLSSRPEFNAPPSGDGCLFPPGSPPIARASVRPSPAF